MPNHTGYMASKSRNIKKRPLLQEEDYNKLLINGVNLTQANKNNLKRLKGRNENSKITHLSNALVVFVIDGKTRRLTRKPL